MRIQNKSMEAVMLKLGNPNENMVLTITVSDNLTKEDYDRVLPELEKMLDMFGSLRFFIRLVDFTGFEIDALWEDIKFDYRHKNQYGRIAIVGDTKWEEWGARLSKLFFDSEMQFFYADQADKAWKWVNS